MRTIKTHDPKNENKVNIEAWDDADSKGLHHKYRLSINRDNSNQEIAILKFQDDNKPGPNGVSDAAMLVVLIDRLECRLKDRTTSSRELGLTRTKLEEALFWLLKVGGK